MPRKKAASKEPGTTPAPTPVADRVARFHEHQDAYHAGRYNETQIRREFIELHEQLASPRMAHAKTAIQRQIDATYRQIGQLVHELYGLTDDEIRIVEEATQ